MKKMKKEESLLSEIFGTNFFIKLCLLISLGLLVTIIILVNEQQNPNKKIINLIRENGYGEVNLLINKKVSNCNSEEIGLAFYSIKEDKKISGTICLSNDLGNYKIDIDRGVK